MDTVLNYNNFDQIAQQVWSERDVNKKREIVISQMINNFKFKQKQQSLRNQALKATASKLDSLAANLVLLQNGDKVIK